jgi:hypothetical protein
VTSSIRLEPIPLGIPGLAHHLLLLAREEDG